MILFCKGAPKCDRKKSGVGADDVHDSLLFVYKSLMFILNSITPRETKETGAVQTKNKESENTWTFEDNNDIRTFLLH
jgi:hypothetical protein